MLLQRMVVLAQELARGRPVHSSNDLGSAGKALVIADAYAGKVIVELSVELLRTETLDS